MSHRVNPRRIRACGPRVDIHTGATSVVYSSPRRGRVAGFPTSADDSVAIDWILMNARCFRRPLMMMQVIVVLTVSACGGNGSSGSDKSVPTSAPASTAADAPTTEPGTASTPFTVEVWADNWMAVYVNGELIGEDSVPITTERSFNSETFSFTASVPFTLAIEAKDFKETDSGIEYIGEAKQQMGDGGIIAQVTNGDTGEVVAVTDSSWRALVVQRAPLNIECEKSANPDAECESESIDVPTDWAAPDFVDTDWTSATEWSAADVSPKDGYNEIQWDDAAAFIWGSDLKVDNTVLLRTSVG